MASEEFLTVQKSQRRRLGSVGRPTARHVGGQEAREAGQARPQQAGRERSPPVTESKGLRRQWSNDWATQSCLSNPQPNANPFRMGLPGRHVQGWLVHMQHAQASNPTRLLTHHPQWHSPLSAA